MRMIRNYSKCWTDVITAIFVLVLLYLFLPLSGFAKNSDSRDTLVLLGNENLAPIVYNDNGTAKGVAVDIAKAIGDKIGYNVQVIAMNWEQAQLLVLNGGADGLLQINPNPERDIIYDFSTPLLKSEFSIFIQSDNVTIKSIDDLRGKNVGVEVGGYPSTLLRDYKGINAVMLYDWETSFKDLCNGDIDAIIVDRWIGEYELAQRKTAGVKILENPFKTQVSRIAVRKGDTETLNLINSGLAKATEDGTIDKIMERLQGKRVVYVTEEYYQTFFLHSFSLFLLLVALVAIYFFTKYRRLSKKLKASVKDRTEELRQANDKLKAANEKLELISMIDGLTSVGNRRAFDIAYTKAWNLSLREGMQLSLIMMDIDHFKVFNDTYGHLAGDQALIKIAEAIKSVIRRPGDLAARYGGEEFVVLQINTTEEGAAVVAEKIRRGIEELRMEIGEIKSIITVSIGGASVVPTDEMAPEELIGKADRALYMAKEEGRNRVIVWNPKVE